MKIDAIWQPGSQQRVFRQLMDAMARPGKIHDLTPWLNGDAAPLGVLATLLDAEVSLADCHGLLDEAHWPLLQAKVSPVERADYILCDGAQPPAFEPHLGTLTCPDEAATLVVRVANLGHGELALRLRGPGVESPVNLSIAGLNAAWLTAREEWNDAFPLGVDLIIADAHRVIGLPRTTAVEVL